MSTAITPINDSAVKYFSDSHSVQSMDSTEEKVQLVESEVPANAKPLTRKLISDALRAKLASGEAENLAEGLVAVAKEGKRMSDRISAIAEIADRTEGKAVQSIRHAGVFMVMAPGAEALQALDSWAEDE